MQLAITYRAVTDLKPYPRNARTHSRKQLKQIAAAIKEFGFTNPVLIDERDQIIAATAGSRQPSCWVLRKCRRYNSATSAHFKSGHIFWPTTGWPRRPAGTRKS